MDMGTVTQANAASASMGISEVIKYGERRLAEPGDSPEQWAKRIAHWRGSAEYKRGDSVPFPD